MNTFSSSMLLSKWRRLPPMEKGASTRQGTLVLDTDSGRMNIRFGLNDCYGFLSCGTRMEVQVDGEWIPTRQRWLTTGS